MSRTNICFSRFEEMSGEKAKYFTPQIILMAMIAFGQYVGGPMSFSSFDIKHVLISGLILFALFYMMICVLF